MHRLADELGEASRKRRATTPLAHAKEVAAFIEEAAVAE